MIHRRVEKCLLTRKIIYKGHFIAIKVLCNKNAIVCPRLKESAYEILNKKNKILYLLCKSNFITYL